MTWKSQDGHLRPLRLILLSEVQVTYHIPMLHAPTYNLMIHMVFTKLIEKDKLKYKTYPMLASSLASSDCSSSTSAWNAKGCMIKRFRRWKLEKQNDWPNIHMCVICTTYDHMCVMCAVIWPIICQSYDFVDWNRVSTWLAKQLCLIFTLCNGTQNISW